MTQPPFPLGKRILGRVYFRRYDLECYKAALLGISPPQPTGVEELVSAVQVAKEFGCHRLTIGRRLKEAEFAAAGARPV
jgi:hypothetical protein